jgi:hypothetical protein
MLPTKRKSTSFLLLSQQEWQGFGANGAGLKRNIEREGQLIWLTA